MNHCKDCCCARSWRALGITEYTGKSIPDHIRELVIQKEQAYTQGRADAVRECEGKVKRVPRWMNSDTIKDDPNGSGFICRYDAILAAIRAVEEKHE